MEHLAQAQHPVTLPCAAASTNKARRPNWVSCSEAVQGIGYLEKDYALNMGLWGSFRGEVKSRLWRCREGAGAVERVPADKVGKVLKAVWMGEIK